MSTHRTAHINPDQSAYIVRKGKAPRPTVSLREALAERLAFTRVQRSGIVEFVTSGEFSRLSIVTQAEIDSPQGRAAIAADPTRAWRFPTTEFGRVGKLDRSSVESIRIWCKVFGALMPAGSYAIIVA